MKVKNLSFSKGEKEIFSNISFNTVESPCIIVNGSNGSGKSTLLKVLLGIYHQSKGQIIVEDTIGYVPDSSENYFVGMSPRIFFNFIRRQYRLDKKRFENDLCMLMREFHLEDNLMDNTILSLSLGEKKKVMLIAAFIRKPKLYIMDEPFSGLDRQSLENLYQKILVQMENGHQFIIVTHGQDEVLDSVSYKIKMGEIYDE